MPGDSPREAFDAFIGPLQRAVSCLGPAKISVPSGGKDVVGHTWAWTLNGVAGMSRQGMHFEAQMHYEIIQDARPDYGPYRITTRAYRYRLAAAGHDLVRFHWHPVGRSLVTGPHLHLSLAMRDPARDPLDMHLPTPRFTFEAAIEWAIEMGWPPANSDYESILAACQDPHLRYRSWGGSTPPPRVTDLRMVDAGDTPITEV